MRLIFKYSKNSENSGKFNPGYLADLAGLITSGLCFIHCWMLPLLLLFLPGSLAKHTIIHPVLCSIAILNAAPLLLKKTLRLQSGLYQFSLVMGSSSMMFILFTHEYLPFVGELILNTVGGCSLVYVHHYNWRKERIPQIVARL